MKFYSLCDSHEITIYKAVYPAQFGYVSCALNGEKGWCGSMHALQGPADLSPALLLEGYLKAGDLLIAPTRWTMVMAMPPGAPLKGQCPDRMLIKWFLWDVWNLFCQIIKIS